MKKSKVKNARLQRAIRHRKLTGAAALRAALESKNPQAIDALHDAELASMLNLSTDVTLALIAAEDDDAT